MQKAQGKLGNAITNNVEAATAPVMGPSGYMGADTFAVALIDYLMGFPMTNTFRELNNRTGDRHPSIT